MYTEKPYAMMRTRAINGPISQTWARTDLHVTCVMAEASAFGTERGRPQRMDASAWPMRQRDGRVSEV